LQNQNPQLKSRYKNIYILTPNGFETGGVEALFQLAHAIHILKGKAFTVFHPNKNDAVLDAYKNYKINRTNTIDDEEENLLIVPEVWTDELQAYKKINKAIWWLSIDNNFGKFTRFDDRSIIHFSQSYYANKYLLEKGCTQVINLYDYLRDDFFPETFTDYQKENIVCYNPKKGMEITGSIMTRMPQVGFVPIENLSTKGVKNLLKRSKVYIDFGHHPGKDRIPREAAIYYNCIITSSNYGAAKNDVDIPIGKQYKFREDQLPEIVERINLCLTSHNEYVCDFDPYRKVIWKQKEEFFNQVRELFV